jgi:hypothetical protein
MTEGSGLWVEVLHMVKLASARDATEGGTASGRVGALAVGPASPSAPAVATFKTGDRRIGSFDQDGSRIRYENRLFQHS